MKIISIKGTKTWHIYNKDNLNNVKCSQHIPRRFEDMEIKDGFPTCLKCLGFNNSILERTLGRKRFEVLIYGSRKRVLTRRERLDEFPSFNEWIDIMTSNLD